MESLGELIIIYAVSLHVQSGQEHKVTQFQMSCWTPEGLCTSPSAIMAVIEHMLVIQRRTGNKPIVVHGRWVSWLERFCSHYRSNKPNITVGIAVLQCWIYFFFDVWPLLPPLFNLVDTGVTHVINGARPSPSLFAYCKRPITEWWEGLGTKLCCTYFSTKASYTLQTLTDICSDLVLSH